MSDYNRATLPARLVAHAGAALIALKTLFGIELLPDPMQTTLGGIIALVGVVWFVIAYRRFKSR